MTFDEYVALAEWTYLTVPSYRRGQAYFNALYNVRADLSEQVRATHLDPFHQDSIIPDFLIFVADNWEVTNA